MPKFASRIVQQSLSTDLTISGKVNVHAFYIFGTTAATTITMKDGDGNTLWVTNTASSNRVDSAISFIADNGLSFTAAASGSTFTVTVLYSQEGS